MTSHVHFYATDLDANLRHPVPADDVKAAEAHLTALLDAGPVVLRHLSDCYGEEAIETEHRSTATWLRRMSAAILVLAETAERD
jgi:hypothetical protein